ncbi:MAG: hypothetical protein LDL07_14770 [Desulfarculus sp.]|nr:hypothetical protein [Desulfarculus sp.]
MSQLLGFAAIIDRFKAAILASDDLADWCQEQFGKPLTLFIGMDQRNPPGEDACPLIILTPEGPASDGEAPEGGQRRYPIGVRWGVVNDGVTTVGNVITYPGQAQADRMGQLIWAALEDGCEDMSLPQAEPELEPIAYFPLIPGWMLVTVTVPVLIGAEIIY